MREARGPQKRKRKLHRHLRECSMREKLVDLSSHSNYTKEKATGQPRAGPGVRPAGHSRGLDNERYRADWPDRRTARGGTLRSSLRGAALAAGMAKLQRTSRRKRRANTETICWPAFA